MDNKKFGLLAGIGITSITVVVTMGIVVVKLASKILNS